MSSAALSAPALRLLSRAAAAWPSAAKAVRSTASLAPSRGSSAPTWAHTVGIGRRPRNTRAASALASIMPKARVSLPLKPGMLALVIPSRVQALRKFCQRPPWRSVWGSPVAGRNRPISWSLPNRSTCSAPQKSASAAAPATRLSGACNCVNTATMSYEIMLRY